MIKKMSLAMLILFMTVTFVILYSTSVYAQGNTKIVIVTDKTEYNVADIVKVTVQGQNVVDMFGLQFTVHYDPGILEMQGDDMTFEGEYTVFGGKTVDKGKGIITYPVINQSATKDKKDTDTVGYVSFKALKKGPVILIMDNIKAVDSNSSVINYNTQTQAVFNIQEKQSSSSGSGNNSNSSTGGSNSSNTSTKDGSSGIKTDNGQTPHQTADSNQKNPTGENNSADNKAGTEVSQNNSVTPKESKETNLENVNSSSSTLENSTLTLLVVLGILIVGSVCYGVKNRSTLRKSAIDAYSRIKSRQKGE